MAAVLLVGCGDENNTPEGMQLIDGGDELGYYFFAPEEWTNGGNMDGIAYTYASRTDRTSVSFTEIDSKTFVKPDPTKSDADFFLEDYFYGIENEIPNDLSLKLEKKGESCLFGTGDTKADKAVKYQFSYLYTDPYSEEESRWVFMQIFAVHDGRYYILTCAASNDERSEGTTYFNYHLDRFNSIIDEFRFVKKTGIDTPKNEYTKDADGDILASDSSLSGFELYVPGDFEVDYSSAIVSATHADGSNLTVTKATATGTTIKQYWQFRKSALDQYVDNIQEVVTNTQDSKVIEYPIAITFANASDAALCEYTYEYNGKTFHVYQIFCVDGGLIQNGYIFTYTALEENYDDHIEDIKRILEKVNF